MAQMTKIAIKAHETKPNCGSICVSRSQVKIDKVGLGPNQVGRFGCV